MKKIGIIAAMAEEMNAVRQLMTESTVEEHYEKTFIVGILGNHPCILTEAGVGKVNAGRTTQLMIDKYQPDYIINVGSAGACHNNLDYGDMVISTACVQTDFDLTAFGRKMGELPELGQFLRADINLINRLKIAAQQVAQNYKVVTGIISTADIFQNSAMSKHRLHLDFSAECTEMEGAAIAQVCTLCRVPFVILRSITDKPDESGHVDFYEYLKFASERCAKLLAIMLQEEF